VPYISVSRIGWWRAPARSARPPRSPAVDQIFVRLKKIVQHVCFVHDNHKFSFAQFYELWRIRNLLLCGTNSSPCVLCTDCRTPVCFVGSDSSFLVYYTRCNTSDVFQPKMLTVKPTFSCIFLHMAISWPSQISATISFQPSGICKKFGFRSTEVLCGLGVIQAASEVAFVPGTLSCSHDCCIWPAFTT